MARTISDEERQLKRRARRRLIGAIVLVTAMVVVLHLVLYRTGFGLALRALSENPRAAAGKRSKAKAK